MRPQVNPYVTRVTSSMTGTASAVDFSRPIALFDGAPTLFEYDLAEISRQPVLAPHISPLEPGIWRYGAVLPVVGVPESYAADVGQTPTILNERLSSELDVELYIKSEGANPTGSFKDRGLAVAIALGITCGARRFALPTQGNAGVSAACFSARAGVEAALVYMPAGHRGSSYARHAASFGAEVRFVGSNVSECGAVMRQELASDLGDGRVVDVSTFYEPGRLEGKKTMGLEIAETFGADALPDAIVYPTGGGTGLVGIWKAFRELVGLGVIGKNARLPRLVAVQSTGCAPVVGALERGLDRVVPVTSRGTVADGLDVPSAIMGHGILRALRESQGAAVAVEDRDIIAEHGRLGLYGVSASYEGAAAVAALRTLRQMGTIARGDRVVVLNTASHLVGSVGAEKDLTLRMRK